MVGADLPGGGVDRGGLRGVRVNDPRVLNDGPAAGAQLVSEGVEDFGGVDLRLIVERDGTCHLMGQFGVLHPVGADAGGSCRFELARQVGRPSSVFA